MSADKPQVTAATFLPLDGPARFKQDPIHCEHSAQYFTAPHQSRLCDDTIRITAASTTYTVAMAKLNWICHKAAARQV